MASQAVATQQQAPISAYERALIFGDITELDERGRLDYLNGMCEASGLNPATKPFGYMEQWTPNGNRLVFYLTATGAAQLRTNHGISITRVVDEGEVPGPKGPCYRWTVYGRTPAGREDVEIGSKPLYKARPNKDGTHDLLTGIDYENARKASLTQAKTRLSKSLTGLAGVLSEDEVDGPVTVAGRPTVTDTTTGEITAAPAPRQIGPAPQPKPEQATDDQWREITARTSAIKHDFNVELPLPPDSLTEAKARAWIGKLEDKRRSLTHEAALPAVTSTPVLESDPDDQAEIPY